jgi:hypothetical protein
MRANIQESLQMREDVDKELAVNLLKKEAQINKLYKPSMTRGLNIHENSVNHFGQKHLVNMHMVNMPDE